MVLVSVGIGHVPSNIISSLTHDLGFYEPIRHFFNRLVGYEHTDQIPLLSLLAGATSGAVGGERGLPD
jgi:hypothetical protein